MKTETSYYKIRKYDLFVKNKETGVDERWIQLGVHPKGYYDYLSDPDGAPVYYGKIGYKSNHLLALGEKPVRAVRCIQSFPLQRNAPDVPLEILEKVFTEKDCVLLQKEWEETDGTRGLKLSEVFSFKECSSLKEALKFIVNWDDLADGEDLVLKEYHQTVETIKKTWETEITR